MTQLRGFRKNSKLYDIRLKESIVSIVSDQARGFLLASFFGGLCGGVCGAIFAVGLGAIFF